MNHETTNATGRPTLFAADRDGTEDLRERDSGPVSILSSIATPTGRPAAAGHLPGAQPSTERRAWAAAAAVVLMVIATVVWYQHERENDTARVAGKPAPAEVKRERPAAASEAQSERSMRAGEAAPAPATAVIETVAAAPSAAADDPFAALAPSAGSTDSATVGSTAAVPPAKEGGSPALAGERASTRKPPQRAAPPVKRSDTKVAAARSPEQDADVDLIEALVSHVAGKDAAPTRREAGVRTTDSSQVAPVAREVVLQQEPAVPTGELVRRCMTLGWLESQLCRARICSGQWGEDPACPLAQQQHGELRR